MRAVRIVPPAMSRPTAADASANSYDGSIADFQIRRAFRVRRVGDEDRGDQLAVLEIVLALRRRCRAGDESRRPRPAARRADREA